MYGLPPSAKDYAEERKKDRLLAAVPELLDLVERFSAPGYVVTDRTIREAAALVKRLRKP